MGTALASGGLAGMARVLGSGYQGPPELTVARAFTEWTLDPWMLVLVLLLGGGYLAGAHRQPGWTGPMSMIWTDLAQPFEVLGR